jgi:F-type H+-transporting ATPase subunit delta
MTLNGIASRYALALVEALTEPSSGIDPNTAIDGLKSFADTMKESHDLELILLSPSVSTNTKRVVIEKIAGDLGLHRLVRNFLLVLNKHRRLALLKEATQQARVLLDEHLGIVGADVFSATEMAAQDKQLIAGKLTQITGKQVRLRITIDPDLIGGIMARVGSTVYDGSVRGQLRALGQRLAAE